MNYEHCPYIYARLFFRSIAPPRSRPNKRFLEGLFECKTLDFFFEFSSQTRLNFKLFSLNSRSFKCGWCLKMAEENYSVHIESLLRYNIMTKTSLQLFPCIIIVISFFCSLYKSCYFYFGNHYCISLRFRSLFYSSNHIFCQ